MRHEVRWERMFPDELEAGVRGVSDGVSTLWVVRTARLA